MDAPKFSLFAWAQLVRLPNVFTVWADVIMAFCITLCASIFHLTAWEYAFLGIFIFASTLCYWAGMILNDVHDFPEDSRRRAERPLVNGKISLMTAKKMGYVMLLAGGFMFLAVTVLVRFLSNPDLLENHEHFFLQKWQNAGLTFFVILLFILSILFYNTRLKNTWAGPFLMGACRALHLLVIFLILSWHGTLNITSADSPLWMIPAFSFIYITGLTFFARNETEEEYQKNGLSQQILSVCALTGGILILLRFVEKLKIFAPDSLISGVTQNPWMWQILIIYLAVFVGLRTFNALLNGSEKRIRRGVKQAIFTLFMVDAALVFTVSGIFTAGFILLMIFPATILGRFFYST
ncbi:MAG: UbiA family prenyltransferase [Planctomycetia bacterium]|nr:UbiA family prenyltransferase [Planctomycetia bacterium]